MRFLLIKAYGVILIFVMAIYHLNVGHVSRSTGRSSVQSAAYITGEKLHETRRALDVNYKNRYNDIAYTNTLAPEGVPDKFTNLGVWDYLESFEDEYAVSRFPHNIEARERYLNSAQTAMTVVVALPRELNIDVCKELVNEFVQTRFVIRGLVVTCAIHDDEGNPHAHFQVSRRSVNEQGELSWAKDREICSKKELIVTRKLWADITNHYLEREGFEERITHKSFTDLGIELEPTQHRGWYADKLTEQGRASRIVRENEQVFENNRQRLIENPSIVSNEITSKQSTFTQLQLLKTIQTRVGDNTNLVAQVFEGALQKAVIVGEGMDGQIRYTSESYQQMEEQALSSLNVIAGQRYEQNITSEKIVSTLHQEYSYLSDEQRQAVVGLTQDHALSCLVGRAGAGKTTTLKAVADIYTQSGHKVIGTSLSALAAHNLGNEARIESHTLHSWLYQWERYQSAQKKFLSFNSVMTEGLFKQLQWYQDLKRYEKAQLTSKSILIVDEAGMIGTRQWNELLAHVKRIGAKLIAVGDDHQFKAIEAGDFFRALKDHASKAQKTDRQQLFELQTIRRQQHAWMRQASHELAQLNVQEALAQYEQRGHIHLSDAAHMASDVATVYMDYLQKNQEGLILAFTRQKTKELNQAIRQKLRVENLISPQDALKLEETEGQEKSFAIGDKVVFLKNDKHHIKILGLEGQTNHLSFIKNGSRGTLESVNAQGDVVVRLQNKATAHFNIRDYHHIDYGYTLTIHKSQGQTVDFTIVAASKNMDSKALYVAMTRHKDDVQLFYTKEEFKTFGALTSHFSRFEAKDLVKDYTIRPEHEAAWQRVQEYKFCILDAAAVLTNKNHKNQESPDWESYHAIKKDQISLGKEILKDFEAHKFYVQQAGLNQEMLQITTGQKKRPLSLMEEKAKLTVQIYGETAQLTRTLWEEVRGNKLRTDPDKYDQFQDLRAERDSLARVILESYPMHRVFVNEYGKTYGINKRTLQNQLSYRDAQYQWDREKKCGIELKSSKNIRKEQIKYKSNNIYYGK